MGTKPLRLLSTVTAVAAVTAVTLLGPGPTGPAAAAGPAAGAGAATTAAPVTTAVTFTQTVPVNIVLVGFPASLATAPSLTAGLPATSTPIVRVPAFYGLAGRDLGLRYRFDYRVRTAGRAFDDAFFARLRATGTNGPLTAFQQDYNDQRKNVRDVTGPVLYVDAPSTEAWLEANAAQRLGIDRSKGYTVFVVSWYSRPDFRFHVYTKTDTVDPDTGFNFGVQRDTRKLVAWGGSSGRSWFYDFSAGPEAWANNWNVDDRDLDGDTVADYRIPPIWEYSARGHRSPSLLPADVGRLVRYVAVNLLFTSSPLYDPLVTGPAPGGSKVVDATVFEDDGDPAVSGVQFLDQPAVLRALKSVEPYYRWGLTTSVEDPIDAKAERSLRISAGLLAEDDCWTAFGDPFAQLYCYFDANRATYGTAVIPGDYRESIYAFHTTVANMGANAGFLGFADDDWATGRQSYVWAWLTPLDREQGVGFTTTFTHEVGHHLGLSHPHDGYDPGTGVDYGPTGEFQYAWLGDEADTVMGYTNLSNRFGVFDRDNLYRWEFAGYLNEAAGLVGAVVADPASASVSGLVSTYSSQRTKAVAAFERWDFLTAATAARSAYDAARRAASRLGVASIAASRTAPAPDVTLLPGSPVKEPEVWPHRTG